MKIDNGLAEIQERGVLVSLITHVKLIDVVPTHFKAEHFQFSIYGETFKVILDLISNGYSPDASNIFERLPHALKNTIKSHQYFVNLLADHPLQITNNIPSFKGYIDGIYERYKKLSLVQIASKFTEVVNSDNNSEDILEEIERELAEFVTKQHDTKGVAFLSDYLKNVMSDTEKAYKANHNENKGENNNVSTGFTKLDQQLNGLKPSQLYMLAGRPSMGKSALATNIAFNIANKNLKDTPNKKNALFFSLEMPGDQIARRILAEQVKISSDKIEKGEVSQDEFLACDEIVRKLTGVGLIIDDTAALSIYTIMSRARRLHLKHKLDLIVVDYLQLINGNKNSKNDYRVYEIAEISKGLKNLSKELNVPVLALSQLSREVEKRPDKRPQLSDLRDSGSIEQDADVVMFVYREAYYEERKEPTPEGNEDHKNWQIKMSKIKNHAEIIIAKNRYGQIGTVKVKFEGDLTKFSDL